MSEQLLARLRELLLNEFSEPELEQLCKDIGLSYTALPGTGTFGKTREIVEAARSQDKLRLLQSRLRELRPAAYAAANIQSPPPPTLSPVGAATTTSTPAQAIAAPATVSGSASGASLAGSVPTTEPADKTAATTATAPRSARWLPVLALALVAFVCLAAITSLVVNRPSAGPATVPNTSANQTADAAAAAAPNSSANSANSPSSAAATDLPPTAPPPAAGAAPALDTPSAPAATAVPPPSAPAVSVTLPITAQDQAASPTAPVAAGVAITPAVALTQPAKTASATTAMTTSIMPTGTLAANQAHPAALMIRDLNEQLPQFYLGQATSEDLQKYWVGEAWRSVVGFGTTKLPRVMRIPLEQRGTLDVTYRYVQPPTLLSERGGVSTVTAREFWRYVNAAHAIEICEVRDYVYNVVEDQGLLKVRNFTSRLLQSGCPK